VRKIVFALLVPVGIGSPEKKQRANPVRQVLLKV